MSRVGPNLLSISWEDRINKPTALELWKFQAAFPGESGQEFRGFCLFKTDGFSLFPSPSKTESFIKIWDHSYLHIHQPSTLFAGGPQPLRNETIILHLFARHNKTCHQTQRAKKNTLQDCGASE